MESSDQEEKKAKIMRERELAKIVVDAASLQFLRTELELTGKTYFDFILHFPLEDAADRLLREHNNDIKTILSSFLNS